MLAPSALRYHWVMSYAYDNKMQKVIRLLFPFFMVGVVGCSSKGTSTAANQQGPALERLPFVYKMTVQQGNILSTDLIDSLELGMSKRQVRFLLGTPLLTDFFHADRWDYTYTIRRGHQPMETKRFSLFFENDALARIEGHYRPDSNGTEAQEPQELIVSVPDWEDRRGLFGRIFSRNDSPATD